LTGRGGSGGNLSQMTSASSRWKAGHQLGGSKWQQKTVGGSEEIGEKLECSTEGNMIESHLEKNESQLSNSEDK